MQKEREREGERDEREGKEEIGPSGRSPPLRPHPPPPEVEGRSALPGPAEVREPPFGGGVQRGERERERERRERRKREENEERERGERKKVEREKLERESRERKC